MEVGVARLGAPAHRGPEQGRSCPFADLKMGFSGFGQVSCDLTLVLCQFPYCAVHVPLPTNKISRIYKGFLVFNDVCMCMPDPEEAGALDFSGAGVTSACKPSDRGVGSGRAVPVLSQPPSPMTEFYPSEL